MKARYLGLVPVEEYKYSNKDRHLLKGLTTQGCEANEGKIFRIGSTTTSTMYNIINNIDNIFNNNYNTIYIKKTVNRHSPGIEQILSGKIIPSQATLCPLLFARSTHCHTMFTYIPNGRRHVIIYLINIKVGTRLVLLIISD